MIVTVYSSWKKKKKKLAASGKMIKVIYTIPTTSTITTVRSAFRRGNQCNTSGKHIEKTITPLEHL